LRITRVKICGITNKTDLHSAVNAGADAVGFIVGVESSPRNLSFKEAKNLICKVPLFVNSVVVAVPENTDKVRDICNILHPNAVQIHGNMSSFDLLFVKEEFPNLRLIRAIKAEPKNAKKRALDAVKNFDAVLLDSYARGKHGGTGVIHNWELSVKIKQVIHPIPMILAGGLNPENISDAISYVQPYAVDVSSGVENHPGIKDRIKIRTFIKRAKDVKK
jgi:phosphoribosylanthranilate isomerase